MNLYLHFLSQNYSEYYVSQAKKEARGDFYLGVLIFAFIFCGYGSGLTTAFVHWDLQNKKK